MVVVIARPCCAEDITRQAICCLYQAILIPWEEGWLMRVSTAAELGIRGMAYLAQNYQNGPVPMAVICREQDLPRQYMLKIFGSLTRAGFVRTTRGKGGGFILGHPPADISILDIIEAVEGPLGQP